MSEFITNIIMNVLKRILGRVISDPDALSKMISDVQPEVQSMVEAGILKAQAGANAAEASSVYKFVSYARVSLLYICIVMFVYSQVLVPGIDQICLHFHHAIPFLPSFDSSGMLNLLYALLGVSVAHHVIPRN